LHGQTSVTWRKLIRVMLPKNDLRINDVEVRVRTLENNQSRTDERLINIIEMLNRIDGRLEKMEGN
jgi:chaperonin cofactor prefoldin